MAATPGQERVQTEKILPAKSKISMRDDTTEDPKANRRIQLQPVIFL